MREFKAKVAVKGCSFYKAFNAETTYINQHD